MRAFVFAALSAMTFAATPELPELNKMIARFAQAKISADTSKLSSGDQKALAKLVEAAKVINDIFQEQLWTGNPALRTRLVQDTTPLGKARLHYFDLNNGPWSDLDGHTAFVPGVPARKPEGANFYPSDISKGEFEGWVKSLAKVQQEQATGFFSIVRRDPARRLELVPYSKAYAKNLALAAQLLNDAAARTSNATLKTFLTLRAKSFLSDDYYDSDVAWMKLDAPIDVTIGPYETYNDELFGYKAAFEAYITLRDDRETEKLKLFSDHLQDIENALPVDPKYRNPKIGALAPIRVVNEVLATGDGAHGVRTAAFNLPNDERIIRAMGSKRVMLKNVQEAKFQKILTPLAGRLLSAADQKDLSFDSFFTHILAHEMSHGIGPQNNVRQSLKELHSAIEEAKADATGLFFLQTMYDRKLLPGNERQLYTTFLASSFRTLRFGVHEAHGRGMALQFNYLFDKGAFAQRPDGTFTVEFSKIKGAVRDLVHDLLTIEATGDYKGAQALLNKMAVLRPMLETALAKAKDLATDIEPLRN